MSESMMTATEQPAVIVKMRPNQNLHQVFRQVMHQVSGRYGQDFVIYDCTDYHPTRRECRAFIRAQAAGLCGSITDPATFTMLVGDNYALPYLAEQFEEQRNGGVQVGVYRTVNEALHHAREARRIFSAW